MSNSWVELEQIPTATVITDLTGAVQAANRRYAELAGGDGGESTAIGLHDWLVDAAGLLTTVTEQLTAGRPVAQVTLSSRDGERLLVTACYRATTDSQHLLMTLQRRQPASAAALPRDLASRLIHDIRSPLNAILGFSRLLQEDSELPATARDFAETISDSAQTLQARIDDCAHIMRTLVDGDTAASDLLRPADLVQETLRAASHAGDIQLTDASGCEQRIITDEAQLRLVLNRMLRCVEPEPETPGQLACSVAAAQDGKLELRISLWPCGPDDRQSDRHPAASDLSFCRQLVRHLGGRTEIVARRLQIVIPVQAAPVAHDKPAPQAQRELVVLESQLLGALHAAARRGDLDALRELLPRVEAHDAPLARHLEELIDTFDYAGIDRALAAPRS